MTRPDIPADEFVPDPRAVPALWGFAMQNAGGLMVTDQVLDLDDVLIAGQPVDWAVDKATGVRWVRVFSQSGIHLAVARAVPLS